MEGSSCFVNSCSKQIAFSLRLLTVRNKEIMPELSQYIEFGFSMNSKCYRELTYFHCPPYFRLYIDGPFGSPFEESLNYEVSLCVAGGIGVTPFASILNTLLYVTLFSYSREVPIFK